MNVKFAIIFPLLLILNSCNRAENYHQKAFEAEEREEYAEAIAYLDQAILLDPEYLDAYLDRAIDKSILGDYAGAIADLDNMISLQPDAIEPHVWKAEYLRMLNNDEEALATIEKAFDLKYPNGRSKFVYSDLNYENPFIENTNYDIESEYLAYERGVSSYNLGKFEQAYRDLSYCVKQRPGWGEAHYLYAFILAHYGQLQEACNELRLAGVFGADANGTAYALHCGENFDGAFFNDAKRED